MSTSDYKERILSAVPIEVYIGKYVNLKKQGRSHKGLCPFHSEKTPSFIVTPDKGIFHCFGCSKGGDLFSFVMEHEGVTFSEALEILGKYAGIEKPTGRYSAIDKRKKELKEINERVMQQFCSFIHSLEGKSFYEYLIKRSIKAEIIKRFQLGASSSDWQWLEERLPGTQKELLELGLIKKSSKNKLYDFFRDRVIFPIQDISGGIVAFGGRVLPGNESSAKYLNSPESIIFQKSDVLYGLRHALPHIRENKECIIAEGYLDVIGLHQAGFANSVAPLGTAFGDSHIKILHRYTNNFVILLDGDRAGRSAALRFARLIVDHGGISAGVVLLPTGMDPFDLSVQYDSGKLKEVLKNRIPLDLYLIMENIFPDTLFNSSYLDDENIDDPVFFSELTRKYYLDFIPASHLGIDEKRSGMNRLFDFLKSLKSATDRDLFLREGARILKINADDLSLEWQRVIGKRESVQSDINVSSEYIKPDTGIPSVSSGNIRATSGDLNDDHLESQLKKCELEIMAIFIHMPVLVGDFLDEVNSIEFSDLHSEIIWRSIESKYLVGDAWTVKNLQDSSLPQEALAAVTGILIKKSEQIVNGNNKAVSRNRDILSDLLLEHNRLKIKKDIEEISKKIQVADAFERELFNKTYAELIKKEKQLESIKRGRQSISEKIDKPDKERENSKFKLQK